MHEFTALCCWLALFGAPHSVRKEDSQSSLLPEIGKPAPEFHLKDDKGVLRSLADYRGKTVVLMFYPQDFTPG